MEQHGNNLGRLDVQRKNGHEAFHADGQDLGFSLLQFWQWSTSDLVSDITRGRLAEYIVAHALGVNTEGVRDDWAAFDLTTPSGIKIEVKSAAFVQSWRQTHLSSITFHVPRTRAWDPDTNLREEDVRRQAGVYVFALLFHTHKPTVDPLNIAQWRFYVVSTQVLNDRTRSQHSITLRSLEKLCSYVEYAALSAAVEAAAADR
ncbi:MAG: hypothetical protein IT329_24095 [Caldilineaceae bacterium]|nr:hypothetical protein [Caldilineaceae bacterium]